MSQRFFLICVECSQEYFPKSVAEARTMSFCMKCGSPLQKNEARLKAAVPDKWDVRLLELAEFVSKWSKDPSTQTGAVIVDPSRRVVSLGYNGFPKGVDDSPERYANRELKYKMIVHCERNALLFANRPVEGCTLYTHPFMSCSVCAAMVVQAGIKRHVAPVCPQHLLERWGDDFKISETLFREAGVQIDLVKHKRPR